MVLVVQVHHLPDSGLDDDLGAVVAGEQGDVEGSAPDVGAAFVDDGVDLRVDDVRVLLVKIGDSPPGPGQALVRATLGKPLYPMPTMRLRESTMHAPTCVLGSLLRMALRKATAMK